MRQICMHQLLYPYCDPARDSQYPARIAILSTEWKDRKPSWIQVDNRVGDPIESGWVQLLPCFGVNLLKGHLLP